MAERESPLRPVYRPGSFGNFTGGAEVRLTEPRPGSIVEVAAWPGGEKAVIAAIRTVTELALPDGAGGGVSQPGKSAFGIAPGRFLVAAQDENLAERLGGAVDISIGAVTDLSHGRTVIRIGGPKSEWVLSKFFALDFSLVAFPEGAGRATSHHDIFAQIQRTGADRFDIYVFRSFARSFWKALCHGAAEVGYEVV